MGRHRATEETSALSEIGRHRAATPASALPNANPGRRRHADVALHSRRNAWRHSRSRTPQRILAFATLAAIAVAPVLARSSSGLGLHDAVAAEIAAHPSEAADTLEQLSRGDTLTGISTAVSIPMPVTAEPDAGQGTATATPGGTTSPTSRTADDSELPRSSSPAPTDNPTVGVTGAAAATSSAGIAAPGTATPAAVAPPAVSAPGTALPSNGPAAAPSSSSAAPSDPSAGSRPTPTAAAQSAVPTSSLTRPGHGGSRPTTPLPTSEPKRTPVDPPASEAPTKSAAPTTTAPPTAPRTPELPGDLIDSLIGALDS